jgi:hypothetical protein
MGRVGGKDRPRKLSRQSKPDRLPVVTFSLFKGICEVDSWPAGRVVFFRDIELVDGVSMVVTGREQLRHQ